MLVQDLAEELNVKRSKFIIYSGKKNLLYLLRKMVLKLL